MSKIIKIMTVFLLAFSLVACKAEKDDKAKPVVYTSFYPVYSLTKSVVGDTVDLRILMPKNQDPHLWEPTPRRIRDLSNSDLLIINGANLEHWADSITSTLPSLDVLNLASGVNLISSRGLLPLETSNIWWLATLTRKPTPLTLATPTKTT